MTVAPVHTPISDFAFKVCQEVKGSFVKAQDTRKKEFDNQGLMGKVAYYAAKVFEVLASIVLVGSVATGLLVLPVAVLCPAVGVITIAGLGLGGLAYLARKAALAVQQHFAKITPEEKTMIAVFTQDVCVDEKSKDALPSASSLKTRRVYLDFFLQPLKEGQLASPYLCGMLRNALGLVEGKKALEEAQKDQKKLTPGQVKLVQDLGTMSAVYLLLESIQHVAANRLDEARKSMKKYNEIPTTAFPNEIKAKITPLVAKLQAPDADFQKKVYNALTKKDMPKGLEAQIFQGIAKESEEKGSKKFTFKLSDLDTVAALA